MVAQELVRTEADTRDQRRLREALATILQAQKQFDREFGSEVPEPSALLIMPRIEDPIQRDIIIQKALALVDRSNGKGAGWGNEGEMSRLKVDPVYSAEAYAERINFGKVRRVDGRQIELDVELPTAEEIAQFKARQ